jgi:DNA-binding CsgD family transcriptional regulator
MSVELTIPRKFREQLGWERLLADIYRTVTDSDAWPVFLDQLVKATASRSARLLVMNREATRVFSSLKRNIDDNCHRRYVEHFVNTCPWRPELRQKKPGRLYSTYLHFSCSQASYYRSEFFNDWARAQDIHHGVCGTIFQDGGRSVQLLVQRTCDQGHYTEAETDFFNFFVPHLQQALLLGSRITADRARSAAIARAAGEETLPFVLLNHDLRIVFASPAAEFLLATAAGLTVQAGRLGLADEGADRRLQQLLRASLAAAAARSPAPAGGMTAAPRAAGSTLQLLVRPIHPDIPVVAGEPPAYVAVYFYDAAQPVRLDPPRLAQLYALSEAEIRVAAALAAAPDLAEVARRCGISLHTVRSHIKAIFAKTGTNSQTGLVKLLLAGPARRR